MSAAERLLEELGVAGREPRALEDLLLRFEARVSHEVVSEATRDPEDAVRVFLEEGVGTAGPERTAAVRRVAETLGFPARLLGGTRREAERTAPHAALLFDLPAGAALADPAFPLPGLVPVGAREVPSPWGRLDLARRGGSLVLAIDAAGRRDETLVLSEDEDALAGVPMPAPGTHVRLLEDRVARWYEGLLEVRDAWSVLTHPLADAEALERLFGLAPETLPERAGPARLLVGERIPGAPSGPEPASATAETGPFAARRYAAERRGDETRLTVEATLRNVPPRGLAEPTRKTLVFHLAQELFAWAKG